MKIDLTKCKTPEDIERVLEPLGRTMAAIRSAAVKAGLWPATAAPPSHDHLPAGDDGRSKRRRGRRP